MRLALAVVVVAALAANADAAQSRSDESLRAAAGLRAPALLVGGRFGSARVLGLDRKGRTVMRGTGRGTTTHLSVCPGGRRVAEIVSLNPVSLNTGYRVAIRDVASLRLVREQTLKFPGRRRPEELLCENGAGSSVVVFARWWCCDAPFNSAVYRLGPQLTPLWNGSAYHAALTRGKAYLCGPGARGTNTVWSLDLARGRVGPRVPVPGACGRFVPDPTGKRLAGFEYGIAGPTDVALVELAPSPKVRTLRITNDVIVGDVLWITPDRLLFFPLEDVTAARILDLRLRTVFRFRWIAEGATLVNFTAFGIQRNGTLRAANLLSPTPSRIVGRLPGTPRVIVAVPR